MEAGISRRDNLGALEAPVWFVAAPGAVGKSTLAREIAARTGAVYVDLAAAATVAGNYVAGGLVKSGLHSSWSESTILLDALDEARLRVTDASFCDFLADVVAVASGHSRPIVLLGRVGVVEEAWYVLAQSGIECPIFDIDFFTEEEACRFAQAALERLASRPEHAGLAARLERNPVAYREASRRFVSELRIAAAQDDDRFAGYAPVLEAIAALLAGEGNPSALNDIGALLKKKRVLRTLAEHVLSREQAKLEGQLIDIPVAIRRGLYGSDEQMGRLAARVLGAPPAPPARSPTLPGTYVAQYERAVAEFISQHPFLDGAGSGPSGAVFAAAIIDWALQSSDVSVAEAAMLYAETHVPTPFLADFYFERLPSDDSDLLIPPEHVGLLYDSLRAAAAAGESVRLEFEGSEDDESADVEILCMRTDRDEKPVWRREFRSSQAGEVRLGRSVAGVKIDAPVLDVRIGVGGAVELIAPVDIIAARVRLLANEVVINVDRDKRNAEGGVVSIEASQFQAPPHISPPIVRPGAEFAVAWPGDSAFPWSAYACPASKSNVPGLDEALRALRRLVMAFRSHSKGRLARFKGKIDHARMSKGVIGVAIRKALVADKVLSLEGTMYYLDPDALGSVVGAAYQDVKMKRYSARIQSYVGQALER